MCKLALIFMVLIVLNAQSQLIPPGYVFHPGPLMASTKGEVWPKPQQEEKGDEFFRLYPLSFTFRVTGTNCAILREALLRYWRIILWSKLINSKFLEDEDNSYRNDPKFRGDITTLQVQLTGECDDDEFPSFEMQEHYTLTITSNKSQKLSSKTIWGILRGLETFSQLIYLSTDLRNLLINVTTIQDYPSFPYRGFLLDTSRHFIPKEYILKLLDALAYNKFNVFHWHIVDDYSFPYESKTYPELSEKGAFHRTMVYDQKFVKEVQLYAKQRGIRVLAEFDTPGHTLSWGLAKPDLLTECYNEDETLTGGYGPINPTKNSTYDFLYPLFDEIQNVFKDQYIHLGGDEVDFTCWKSNPEITEFMKVNDIEGDYFALQSNYIQKVIDYVTSKNLSSIVWEEVFLNGGILPKSTVVHVWIEDTYPFIMSEVTNAGHNAIHSGCFYLDKISTGGDWLKFFQCDVLDFIGTDAQKALVLGGEACMWSEVVNAYNLESRVWPRASAIAERLWSAPVDTHDIPVIWEAASRLEEQTCRLNKRGIGAQPPTGPSFCYY